MTTRVWPKTCSTCGEPYNKEKPSFRALICSNGFHTCRDCTWTAGRLTERCAFHSHKKEPIDD